MFLLIYFVVRFWGRPSDMLKKAGICLFCGVLGVGMAAVLFIPSILFVLTNPRTNIRYMIYYLAKKKFLFIIKGILFAGEAMNNQSCVIDQHWNSTACYLPNDRNFYGNCIFIEKRLAGKDSLDILSIFFCSDFVIGFLLRLQRGISAMGGICRFYLWQLQQLLSWKTTGNIL